MSISSSRRVAYAATFGAFAGLLSLIPAIPGAGAILGFPVLTYLLLDPAEIFDFLAYFFAGPKVAVPTALIHFLFLLIAAVLAANWLNFAGAFVKLAAVLSSFLGLSIGLSIYERARKGRGNLPRLISSSYITAGIARVLILLPINVIFILVITPLLFGSLDKFLYCPIYCPASLLNAVGVHTSGFWDLMGWILMITSIYNVVQLVIAAIPSYVLLVYSLSVTTLGNQASLGQVWIATRLRSNSTTLKPENSTR